MTRSEWVSLLLVLRDEVVDNARVRCWTDCRCALELACEDWLSTLTWRDEVA